MKTIGEILRDMFGRDSITETELDQKIRDTANEVFTERMKTWEG